MIEISQILGEETSYRTDTHGIIHLNETDYFYREVPRSFFAGIVAAKNSEEGMRAFERSLELLPREARKVVEYYALDPRRAISLTLGSVRNGAVVLDYGCGWGTLARVVSRLGGTVVAVDATYESLLLSRFISGSEREVYMKGGRELPLPFREGVFDTVILNGVLEWLPEDNMMDIAPAEVQRRYLVEFFRVLKPGGRIIVGIENRHSFYYWAGRRDDHTGLRFGAVLPRWGGNLVSQKVRGKPYRTLTYTRHEYRRLLQGAGFESSDFFVPWPRYRRSEMLVSGNALPDALEAGMEGKETARQVAARRVLKTLQTLRLLIHFVPDYYIVSRKGIGEDAHAPEAGPSFLEDLVREFGGNVGRVRVFTSEEPAFLVLAGTQVYKVPLAKNGGNVLVTECEMLELLRSLPESAPFRDFVPDTWTLSERKEYACFKMASGAKGISAPRKRRGVGVVEFLGSFLEETSLAAVGETNFGTRFKNLLEREDLVRLVPGEVMDTIVKTLCKEVPSGLVHGDLCREHVAVMDGGRTMVVAWGGFDRCSPKYLDCLHWYLKDEVRWRSRALPEVVKEVSAGAQTPWLSRYVWPLLGNLSPYEAVLIYLTDRLVRDGVPRATASGFASYARRERLHAYEDSLRSLVTLLPR